MVSAQALGDTRLPLYIWCKVIILDIANHTKRAGGVWVLQDGRHILSCAVLKSNKRRLSKASVYNAGLVAWLCSPISCNGVSISGQLLV